MRVKSIVFESPSLLDKLRILLYIRLGYSVYVIEPFNSYHHRGQIRFYPLPLPAYIDDLIKRCSLSLISADSLGSRDINLLAAEKAVKSVEKVFPVYRKKYGQFVSLVVQVLKSEDAERIFKKNLCDRLADFYSLNIILHRLAKQFDNEPILVFPHANVQTYLFFQDLISKSKQDYYANKSIRFPILLRLNNFLENRLNNLEITVKLLAQLSASIFLPSNFSARNDKKKNYRYGVSIISPGRQLRSNQRGPDFILDNCKIKADEVVYLSLVSLDRQQFMKLSNIGSDVHSIPRLGRFFSNRSEWAKLFFLSIKTRFLQNANEIEVASFAFFNYFRWHYVMRNITIRHFISHCDFGISHIARNILLKQYGVETWYFTDAINFGHNMRENNSRWNRHPNWTYLYYDNFVTWYEDLKEYFSAHHQTFSKTHIVGCLWSGHVKLNEARNKYLTKFFTNEESSDKFVIATYSSTYTVKSITSYEEGIIFAQHLLKLAEDLDDIVIILKEKKERAVHLQLEPRLGSKLLELYDRMDKHSRIKICDNQVDTSNVMAVADMCVSFPFTSTTIEALSSSKPAIWHDPMGNYKKTPYARNGGVVTHSYSELKEKVIEIKKMISGTYQDPAPKNSPLFDPFRDGKAIERFRDLLTSE